MRLWGKQEETVDPEAVKARSMAEVRRLGGKAIDSLPFIDVTEARTSDEVAARTLVLNALVGLAYEAPAPLLRDWIEANGLRGTLSFGEAALLQSETGTIEPQALNDLQWSIKALDAFLWAGGFVDALPIDGLVSMETLAPLPKVGAGESGRDFARRVRLRPYAELYAMRDLY